MGVKVEEVFAVGTVLNITGNAAEVVAKLAADMERLTRLTNDTKSAFGALGADLRGLNGAGGSIRKLLDSIEKLNKSSIGGTLTADIDKMTTATRGMLDATEAVGRAMQENARIAADAAKQMSASGGGGGPRRPAEPKGFGGHDFMLTGLAAGMVGAPLTGFYSEAVAHGLDVGHMRAVLQADDRITAAQAQAAQDAAAGVSQTVRGTTIAGNLGMILDLKQVTGSLPEAMAALPEFAKLVTTLQAIDGRSGGSGDPAFAAAKAIEILGRMTSVDASGNRHVDADELARNVGLLAQVAIATNGRVDPASYLAFAKQARVGGMSLNDSALFYDFPALMMVLGGSRAGTGEAATYSQFANGTMTENTFNMMKAHKLISAKATWKGGRVQNMGANLVGADLFDANPVEWARQVLIPELKREGITDPVKQAQAVASFSGRQTTAGFLGEIVRAIVAIDKESGNLRHTRSDSYDLLQDKDPSQQLRNVEAAWQNLLTSFGSAAADQAAAGLNHMADALNAVAKWAEKNPLPAKVITDIVGGLGAVAVALGTLSTAIFLFGPALKLLRGAEAGGAGAAAGGAATGAAIGGRGGLWGAAIGAALGLLLSNDGSWVDQHIPGMSSLDDWLYRKTGGVFGRQSVASSGSPIPVIVVNPGDVANGVKRGIANDLNAPPTGSAGPHARTGISFPSVTPNALSWGP